MTLAYSLIIAMSVVIALLGILVIGLLRSHADILRRLESLGAGLDGDSSHEHGTQISLAERDKKTSERDVRIVGVSPDGESLVTSLSSGNDPTLVAFLSTTCSSCTPFWEGLESSSMHFGGHRHRVLVVTLGEDEESPSRAKSLAHPGLDVVMSSTGWREFEVPGAPYFALVEPGSGRVLGEGTATTFESLVEFLSDSTNDRIWDESIRPGHVDEESRIDADLRRAGILPGDPRLYPAKGDVDDEAVE